MHSQRFVKAGLVPCIFAASFAALSSSAFAEDGDGGCSVEPGIGELKRYPGVYNFYYENDLFAGTDNNYTNGIKLSWVSTNLGDYIHDPCLPQWIRELNRFSERLQPGPYASRNMVVSLGQEMYTPTDKDRRDVIPDDRPYAGWLYMGFSYNARKETEMDTVEIDVGMVGPASLAHQAQDFIHDLRGIDKFQGWSNQLHNELGVIYVREKKNRILDIREQDGPKMDAIAHYGYALGNVKTYLNAGMEFRIGTYLPNDFGTSPIRPASDSNAPLPATSSRRLLQSGMHAFVSFDMRAVARNIFLDGNTFADSHSVDKKHLVGDVAAGIAWQWPGVKLTYAQYLRSKEFEGQDKAQSYGSLTVSFEY